MCKARAQRMAFARGTGLCHPGKVAVDRRSGEEKGLLCPTEVQLPWDAFVSSPNLQKVHHGRGVRD